MNKSKYTREEIEKHIFALETEIKHQKDLQPPHPPLGFGNDKSFQLRYLEHNLKCWLMEKEQETWRVK